MHNLDKKYYWVGLGIVLFTLIAVITVNFTNSNQLQGNLTGTIEEYNSFNTTISAKIKAAEELVANLKTQTANNTELLTRVQAEEKKIDEVKSNLSSVSEPSNNDYFTVNQTLSTQLAIVEDAITKLNAVTDQLNTVPLSCPLNDSANSGYATAKNFEDNLKVASEAVDLLGSKTEFGTTEENIMDSLYIDLVVLIGEYQENSTNCFAMSNPDTVESQVSSIFNDLNLTNKVSTLNDAIKVLNNGPIKCAKQLNCSTIKDLEPITLPVSCPAGTSRDASGQCVPLVCPVANSYAKFDVIYGQLQMFTSAPSTFNSTAKTTLVNNLSEATAGLSAEESALYTNYISNFEYSTQANGLINTINGTINRYKAANAACTKSNFATLNITETSNVTTNSEETIVDPENNNTNDPYTEPKNCPVDSVYFEESDSCLCINGLSDVEEGGSCPIIGDEPDTPVDTVEPEQLDETQFTCEDGTIVDDLMACPANLDADLLGSADDSLSLNSNTDPNVMYSATVQGETGLAPILVLIFLGIGIFNLLIWIK